MNVLVDSSKNVSMSQRKLKTLTIAQRVEVLKLLEQNESQSSIAKKFDVGQAVVSRIKKDKDKILNEWLKNTNPNQKRKRTGKAKNIEETLLRWFTLARSKQLPVSGPLLKEKAEQIARELEIGEFVATTGWLERWKCRNNIKFKKQHGGRHDADDWATERWVSDVLPELISGYSPGDIFNVDETGLYWRATPDNVAALKATEACGSNMASERIIVLLAANMDGSEKLEPLVIGKSENPCCFRNVRHLPVAYKSNNNAWVTASAWEGWLREVDQVMRFQRRTIIILCDESIAHTNDLHLTNVKLSFFPTSLVQPMNQGIISNFKRHYRSLVLRQLITFIESGANEQAVEFSQRMSLLDALHMVRQAWNKIGATTIVNCFRRASFMKEPDSVECNDASLLDDTLLYKPEGMDLAEFEHYVAIDSGVATEGVELESCLLKDAALEEIEENNYSLADSPNPPSLLTTLQAVDVIRRYMETNGCTFYEHLYELQTQLFQINRKNSAQRSIKDYSLKNN